MGQPLRLEALTLRGIGPYYDTARLELLPITILCGKNGSGKSTWFKALDLVRRSTSFPRFPFDWDVPAALSVSDIDTVNARLYLRGDPERPAGGENTPPPGTIGLEFLAVADCACRVPYERQGEGHATQAVLWAGLIPRGTRISICLTHPQIASGDEPTQLHDEVRLTINGQHHLWFHRPLGQNGEYRFECSGSFARGGSADDLSLSPVCSFDPRAESVEPSDPDWDTIACRNAVELIRQIATTGTAGVFHLGAIRPIQQLQDVEAVIQDESVEAHQRRLDSAQTAKETRRVGEDGRYAGDVFRAFAYNRMARTATSGQPVRSPRAISEPEDDVAIGYVFEGFVSQWMHKLIGVRVSQRVEARGPKSTILDAIHEDAGPEPLGFLESTAARPIDRGLSSEPSALAVFEHRYFGWEQQPPGRFSAGFHQLLPIIVQVGLMQRHEAFFVENPEVHLHPSLQVELTEFLMQQAGEGQGRIIVIETQSDLVIRRMMRAMLEEDPRFPERMSRIYFGSLERLDDVYDQARLVPLALDHRGHISNWPEGFLDTSANESGRLLRAMYGEPPSNGGDE